MILEMRQQRRAYEFAVAEYMILPQMFTNIKFSSKEGGFRFESTRRYHLSAIHTIYGYGFSQQGTGTTAATGRKRGEKNQRSNSSMLLMMLIFCNKEVPKMASKGERNIEVTSGISNTAIADISLLPTC